LVTVETDPIGVIIAQATCHHEGSAVWLALIGNGEESPPAALADP